MDEEKFAKKGIRKTSKVELLLIFCVISVGLGTAIYTSQIENPVGDPGKICTDDLGFTLARLGCYVPLCGSKKTGQVGGIDINRHYFAVLAQAPIKTMVKSLRSHWP